MQQSVTMTSAMKSPGSAVQGRKRSYDVKHMVDDEQKKAKVTLENNEEFTDQHVRLNNGAVMPWVQFGTYKMKGEDCYKATLSALQAGYRGLDTASVYDNEKEVGKAIVDSGVPRDQVFVQTKLWRSFVGPTKGGKKPKCEGELRKSLRRLGLAKVDLWLIHWPGPGRHLNYPPVRQGMARPKEVIAGNKEKMVPLDWSPAMRLDTYREMARFVKSGEVGALGVCNFSARQMRQLLQFCGDHDLPRPAVVQNECHPLLPAREVRELCKEEGIVFQAYASLGAGSLGLLDNKTVVAVADRVGVTPAQVLLRWGIQGGCTLLPKSVNHARQVTNLSLWDFKLDKEDLELLRGLDTSQEGQNTMAGWLREHDPDFY